MAQLPRADATIAEVSGPCGSSNVRLPAAAGRQAGGDDQSSRVMAEERIERRDPRGRAQGHVSAPRCRERSMPEAVTLQDIYQARQAIGAGIRRTPPAASDP